MKKYIFLLFMCGVTTIGLGQSISEETKLLARCETTYLYLAHLSQMKNNEGLAKNLLSRASRVTTAHLFLNEVNGAVSEEILDQIKSIRRKIKPSLDSDPESAILRASECDKSVPPVISKVRLLDKIWDNKNFDEWQQILFNGYRKSLGIN